MASVCVFVCVWIQAYKHFVLYADAFSLLT